VAERPTRPEPPPLPACASSGSCGDGVADDYNRRVNAFHDRAKDYQKDTHAYVAKLNAFVAGAEAFAKCEVAAMSAGR
jgi:hypothetical protein